MARVLPTPCDPMVLKGVHSIYNTPSFIRGSTCYTPRTMKFGFRPKEVTQLTGLPYSTLNLWAKNGLVEPSLSTGKGSGNARIYSFSDLASLKIAAELRKAGVTTRALQKVVKYLREHLGMEKPLNEARLVVRGKDVLIVDTDRKLISTLSEPGQGYLSFVVDIPRTLGELVELANRNQTFAVGVTGSEASAHRYKKQLRKTSSHLKQKRA